MTTARPGRRLGLLVGAGVLAALSLAGCGSSTGEEPAPAVTSPSASPSTSAAVSSGPIGPSDTTLPEGWIPELPLPASATLISLTVSPDGRNLNSIWTVEDTAAEAAAAYGTVLGTAGLASLGTIDSEGMSSTDYAGAGLLVNVVATSGGGQTGLIINASRD